MALGGITMTDTDGNIGVERTSLAEKVCGLLFDISAHSDFWETTPGTEVAARFKDTVVEFNSLQEAVKAGIEEYSDLTPETAKNYLLNGVAYYHIKHFFNRVGGSGRLYVMFADCTTNFNAIIEMQRVANGTISQFGVWTEQSIWKIANVGDPTYQNSNLKTDLNTIAATLANDYAAPCVITLCGNSAKVKTTSGTQETVDIAKIPSVITKDRYVAVLLSQGRDSVVSAIQQSLDSKTPVGTVGCVLGSLADMNVADSIGWVQGNEVTDYFPDIEMGFGDVTVEGGNLKNTTPYYSLTINQLNALEEKGYVFLCKYAGFEGSVYFSGDTTCSDGDYRTLGRNRVINKSRRNVRIALLPYVNSKLKIDPSTGQLSSAQITIFTNAVTGVLDAMESAEEISGTGTVTVPANQNILQNDKLTLSYKIVPMGTSKEIIVEEGFALNSQA